MDFKFKFSSVSTFFPILCFSMFLLIKVFHLPALIASIRNEHNKKKYMQKIKMNAICIAT